MGFNLENGQNPNFNRGETGDTEYLRVWGGSAGSLFLARGGKDRGKSRRKIKTKYASIKRIARVTKSGSLEEGGKCESKGGKRRGFFHLDRSGRHCAR